MVVRHSIMSDRIEGGSLLLPPDIDADVVIELKPVRAVFLSSDEGMRLLPVVTSLVAGSALESLLTRARALGLAAHLTDRFYDIDVAADLSQLANEL
jgi:hypothetical protein